MNDTSQGSLLTFEPPTKSSSSLQNFGSSESTGDAVFHQTGEPILPESLRGQLEFEKARAELSATFINLQSDRVDGEITNGLAALVEAMGGERATIAVDRPRFRRSDRHPFLGSSGIPRFPKRPLKVFYRGSQTR